MKLLSALQKPLLVTLVFMVLCGLGYPLLLTGLSQVFFPYQANGSLVEVDGSAVGSALVGQEFTDSRFLWGRPSAVGYNTYAPGEHFAGPASGSQNYGPSNPALTARVEEDIRRFRALHPGLPAHALPGDLFTASASGLDPDISPAAAALQLPQLARTTGLTEKALAELVAQNTQGKFLGLWGEPRVNVLGVNLAIAQALDFPQSLHPSPIP